MKRSVKEELSPSLKKGHLPLIPQTNKDPLFIDNWRPITLNNDYKMTIFIVAKLWNTDPNKRIQESHCGFVSGIHISIIFTCFWS